MVACLPTIIIININRIPNPIVINQTTKSNIFPNFQAITDEGLNPDEHVFNDSGKSPSKVQLAVRVNGDDSAKDDDEEQADETVDDSDVKKDEATNGTHDEETGDNENDTADKLLDNNIDNEDSLNLTIGEDEAKIFQDEVRMRHGFYVVQLKLIAEERGELLKTDEN